LDFRLQPVWRSGKDRLKAELQRDRMVAGVGVPASAGLGCVGEDCLQAELQRERVLPALPSQLQPVLSFSTQSLLFSLFLALVVSAISAVKNQARMRLRIACNFVASAREFCATGLLWGEKTIIVKHWLDAPARREPNLLMSKILPAP
jgi:hypothetical protein